MSKTCHYCGADLTHYDADNDTIQPPATQQDDTLLRECAEEVKRCPLRVGNASNDYTTGWDDAVTAVCDALLTRLQERGV